MGPGLFEGVLPLIRDVRVRLDYRVSSSPPWTATPLEFFARHPVFSLEEFEAAYEKMGPASKRASRILAWHVKEGRLFHVRRGLFVRSDEFDPWVIASKLADDVVISHDGALSFLRVTGLGNCISFTTSSRTSRVVFDEVIYEPVRVKEPRIEGLMHERSGQHVFALPLSRSPSSTASHASSAHLRLKS